MCCDRCGDKIPSSEDAYELDGEVLCYTCALDACYDGESEEFKEYLKENDIYDEFLETKKVWSYGE